MPIIRSDDEALRKILLNLASNAVKCTDAGGRVRASVRPDRDPSFVRIEVEDTGIGIEKDDQARIFEKFSQVRRNEHSGGSGIGLFLVKSLAEGLGGSVSVSSAIGRGSTFTVLIPVEEKEGT